jgi:hypothetical protein
VQPGSQDPIGAFLQDSDASPAATGSVIGAAKPPAATNTRAGASAGR